MLLEKYQKRITFFRIFYTNMMSCDAKIRNKANGFLCFHKKLSAGLYVLPNLYLKTINVFGTVNGRNLQNQTFPRCKVKK